MDKIEGMMRVNPSERTSIVVANISNKIARASFMYVFLNVILTFLINETGYRSDWMTDMKQYFYLVTKLVNGEITQLNTHML